MPERAETTRLLIAVAVFVAVWLAFAVTSGAWAVHLLAAAWFLACTVFGDALLRCAFPALFHGGWALVAGAAVGVLAGRIGVVVVGFLTGMSVAPLSAVPIALALAGALLRRRCQNRWDTNDADELAAGAALAALVLALMLPPFAAIGGHTELGEGYVRYFNRDFVQHSAIVAELTRSVPPQNPYFAGETLHYYWFSHTWAAALTVLGQVTATSALTATVPFGMLVFVAGLLHVVRPIVAARLPRVLAVAVSVVAFSYVGFVFIFVSAFPELVSRYAGNALDDYTWLSHSWFRDFLYEPHAVFALGLLLVIVHVARAKDAPRQARAQVLAGLLIGCAIASDAFIGAVTALWYGAGLVTRVLSARRLSWTDLCAPGVAAIIAAAAYVVELLPHGRQPVVVQPHELLAIAPAYLAIDLGPIFVLAMVGAVIARRKRLVRWDDPVIGLLVVSLAIGFLVRMPIEDAIALRKSLKVAQVALVGLMAIALESARDWPRRKQWAVAVVASAGLVSLGTDLYQHTALTSNPEHTIYVSADERAAYDWLRTHTPPTTPIQVFGEARPKRKFRSSATTVIHGLTERRTLWGNYEMPWLFQVDPVARDARQAAVEQLYVASTPDAALHLLCKLPPHLLLVRDAQWTASPALAALRERGVLPEVFRSGSLALVATRGLLRPTSGWDSCDPRAGITPDVTPELTPERTPERTPARTPARTPGLTPERITTR